LASPSEPLRLLYLCFERIVPGTAASTHVHEICDGLRRRGFSVNLKAQEGIMRGGSGERLLRYLRILGAAIAALRHCDVLYVRSHFAAFPVALVAALRRTPMIQEINGAYDDAFVTHPRFGALRRILSWMQRAQYRWSSALVAVTQDLVSWGREQAGHSRAFLVSNAANTDLFRPDGPKHRRDRPYVLFFGGLVRWHGIEVMLEAARLPSWPDIDLVIAGPIVDESLRPMLDEAPGNVVWLGPQAQAALPPVVRGALATLVPISDPDGRSSRGVMPLKLFEALACGTPVVVTDLPGQAELVRQGRCGLVIPVGDPEALAQAVATLASDPDGARQLGEAGAHLILAEHSWDARAAQVAHIATHAIAA
jgi:glycosyltransferase involved in cell wall biosynthesis